MKLHLLRFLAIFFGIWAVALSGVGLYKGVGILGQLLDSAGKIGWIVFLVVVIAILSAVLTFLMSKDNRW